MTGSSDLNAEMYNMIKKFNTQRDNICDSECQKNNEILKLTASVTRAKDNLLNAPSDLLNAQRKLSTYDSLYKTTFNDNIQKIANNEINKLSAQFKNTKNNIYQNLDYYDTQINFKDSINEIDNYYNQKINDSQKKINAQRGKVAVNHRLATFYSRETTLVDWLVSYLKILYWILFSILVIATMFLFFNKSVVNKSYIILGILSLLIIPLYKTLTLFTQKLYTIFSLFPKP
jgi:hypothetical protein